jgi:hypothetical protein
MTKLEMEKQEAKERLLAIGIKPGDTIYTKLVHVSRSGMYRVIDMYVIKDNIPLRISWSAGTLLEGYDQKHEGAKASGCGMDMGFHLVYNLGYALFGDGFGCIGDKCPSNDHSNGDRDYTPHMSDVDIIGADGNACNCHKEHWHKTGGYALKHAWM